MEQRLCPDHDEDGKEDRRAPEAAGRPGSRAAARGRAIVAARIAMSKPLAMVVAQASISKARRIDFTAVLDLAEIITPMCSSRSWPRSSRRAPRSSGEVPQ